MKKTKTTSTKIFIENLETGKARNFKNMTVIPLFSKNREKTRYLTLKKAIKRNLIEITEKDYNGEVPELRVINKSNKRILLVDGEELAGAKQNRILNTTILLKKKTEIIIPVSCTESGRWNYTSDKFNDSGNIAIPKMRVQKNKSVSKSLHTNNHYRSDQNKIWDEVDKFLEETKMKSPTKSMKDAYDRKKTEVNDYMKKFKMKEGQRGFIVIINGEITGFEFFSYSKAFKSLYAKILRSYAVQAHLQYNDTQYKEKKKDKKKSVNDFIKRISDAGTSKFKSPGHGYDYRITGNNITGNMLVYRGEVIHFAAFNSIINSNFITNRTIFDYI